MKQHIIQHDLSLAEMLAAKGELMALTAGTDLIVQANTDNEVYFLLAGEGNIFVNDRFVGSRNEGTCVGEMAAFDPAATRSATIRAKTVPSRSVHFRDHFPTKNANIKVLQRRKS
jgi:CRP-like cAMP-binding protein